MMTRANKTSREGIHADAQSVTDITRGNRTHMYVNGRHRNAVLAGRCQKLETRGGDREKKKKKKKSAAEVLTLRRIVTR